MKFVYFGYDSMLTVAVQLIEAGHELSGVMSFPCDQMFNFNHNCQALAKKYGASYIESPVSDIHIDSFLQKGVQLFVSAGYPYKIPYIDEGRAYGVNIHPSFLPYGRGLMPVPYILAERNREAAGYTIHKLTSEFDAGDILFQEHIALNDVETVESYCAKILTKAPLRMAKMTQEIADVWSAGKPQGEAKAMSYPMPSQEMRTLDWGHSVSDILNLQRAFGRYGSYGYFKGALWNIYACDGWVEAHAYEAGDCIELQNNLAIIAVADGFIALKEFSKA